MDGKNDCNSKLRDSSNSSNHNNNGHDIGEDTSQSGGDQEMHSSRSCRKSKRHASSPTPPEPRSSKRTRHQYQPFQSPTLHIPQLRPTKSSEEKEVVFFKGEFLALRNESGSFYVCQAAQNVYKSSHRFKIRWLSKADNSGPDMYSRDFYDYTDYECVLTNLQLERLDKNLFRLPKSEVARTENILKRALNLENGIHDVEQDKNEAELDTSSGDDSDIKEIGRVTVSARRASVESSKGSSSSRRLRISVSRNQPATRAAKAKLQKVILNSRLRAKANKGNKVKVKQKSISKEPVKSGGHKVERLVLKPKRKSSVAEEKKVKPNSKVSLYNKDPTFESTCPVPFISTVSNSKLLIRHVLMNDMKALQGMLHDSSQPVWVEVQRSIDQKMDALTYALIDENHKAIELLMKCRHRSAKPAVKFPDMLLLHHNVGRTNFKSLGSAVREITLSRGAREGNNALMKDSYEELTDHDYIVNMLKRGVSKSTIDVFVSHSATMKQSVKSVVLSNLYRAISSGHRNLAAELMEEALQVEGYGFTLLHKEVLVFDRQELRTCRSAIVKKRSVGNCGITPVHCAAINPSARYLKQLLDTDPDCNVGDLHMRRPVHYAAACEGSAPLELLISRGFKVDESDSDGNTALHIAAETSRVANIELLLKHAKTEKRNASNDAKLSRDHGLGGLNRPNRSSYTALHLACIAGHLDAVKILVKSGADIEKQCGLAKSKVTSLMLACQHGHLEVVKFLVQSGAKLDMRDKLRRTAIMHAVINGHAHVVSHLLRLGCDPNVTDSSGNTLLHYAVAYGWWFCVRLLVDAVTNINHFNDWKVTPLGIAFLKGHLGLVTSLLSQTDIDIEFRDDNGMNVVMLAVCSPLIAKLVDVIRYLIVNKKARCDTVDINGNTALHWLACNSIHLNTKEDSVLCLDAVQTGLQVAKLLLENGCDAAVRNHRGQTVLTLAIQQGNNELVQLLLNDGCQVTAEVDDTGENLLHALVDHSWETDLASVVQVIKESVGKKAKVKSSGEDSIVLDLQDPVMPLSENLDSLKVGDVIHIYGLRNKAPDKLSISLIQGKDPEKDNILFECAVQQTESGPGLMCRRRISGVWENDGKNLPLSSIVSASQSNDGKVGFELDFLLLEEQLHVMSCGEVLLEFPMSSPFKTSLLLYICGDVVIKTVQLQRSSLTKSAMPAVSLPSDVLREMAQTYSYDGFTPLLLACSKYQFMTDKKQQSRMREMIKTLVEEAESEVHAVVKKRSDNKSRNIDGFSALHFMASAREASSSNNTGEDSMDVAVPGLQLLLNYKPPINIQDHRGRTPLITAILSRQPAAAEALINAGADINLCSGDMDDDGCASPLILSAKLGLVPVIKLLLKHGANVHLADAKNHSTALHYSVTMKTLTDSLEIVQLLIEAGIDINSVNQDGRTPLHLAVNANSGSTDDVIEIEDLMIEKGANLMARDSLGRLPLHYAFVKIGRPVDTSKIDPIEVVSLLTGAMQCNLDIADHYGQTPLHCAAFRGAIICCMHLAQSMTDINAVDKNGNTALSLAVLGSHDSCAIMLLQKGASIHVDVVVPPLESHARDKDKQVGWQWKHIARQQPVVQRCPLLQEVIKKDWQGVMYMMLGQLQTTVSDFFPAVEAALKMNKFKLALNLIARSKNYGKLNACNNNEQNLLHVLGNTATSENYPELQVKVAQVLVNCGVPVNVPDIYGSFPITYAAMHRNSVLCEFLTAQLGIDVVTKLPADKLGRTPLSAALWSLGPYQWRDEKLKELRRWCLKLCSHGMSCNVLVAYPYFDNHPGEAWPIVNNCTELRLSEPPPRISPLIFAVCLRDYDLVAFLLKQGADVNFPDKRGRTPLMVAVCKNDVPMARLLLNPKYCYKKDIWNLLQKKHLNKCHGNKGSTTLSSSVVSPKRRPAGVASVSCAEPLPRPCQSKVMLKSKLAKHDGNNSGGCNQNCSLEVKCGASQNKNTDLDSFNCYPLDYPDCEEMDVGCKDDCVTKTNVINLSQTDQHGWTVIHHLVRPFSCGSYDSEEMLNLLAESGAPLDVSNTAGFSPLQMAIQGRSYRLAAALRKLIGKPKMDFSPGPIVEFTVKDGIQWEQPAWDYKADAAAVLERVESEAMEEGEEDSVVLPDIHSGMEEMGEVVLDTEQNLLYDAFLTKVDMSGCNMGCYSFFKMQVITQQGRNLYVVFTRSGKLGSEGEHQQMPYCTAEDAVKEFCRIFKAKTGNNWQDVKKFQPVARKYRLVEALQRGRKKLRDIPLTIATEIPSKLPVVLVTLMQHLCHVPMLQEACQDVGIDTAVMPFSRLCDAALRHGRQILRELRNVVMEKVKSGTDTKVRDRLGELSEKIVDLSSEYFQTVPQPGYVYEKVRPLDKVLDIQNCLDNLEYMFDLELVSKILLGAQLRIKDVNTMDYVYRALNCQISAMQEDEIESQYILQYIYNTALSQTAVVERMYRVSRKSEAERPPSECHENRWLLWHGTHMSRLASILVRGLNAVTTDDEDNKATKELRFADTFKVAQEMCRNHCKQKNDAHYALLCEVPLRSDFEDASDSTGDCSVSKIPGTYFPDPACNIVLTSGVTVPLGAMTCRYSALGVPIRGIADYNDYLVTGRETVTIRYLVRFRCEPTEHQKVNKVPTHT